MKPTDRRVDRSSDVARRNKQSAVAQNICLKIRIVSHSSLGGNWQKVLQSSRIVPVHLVAEFPASRPHTHTHTQKQLFTHLHMYSAELMCTTLFPKVLLLINRGPVSPMWREALLASPAAESHYSQTFRALFLSTSNLIVYFLFITRHTAPVSESRFLLQVLLVAFVPR